MNNFETKITTRETMDEYIFTKYIDDEEMNEGIIRGIRETGDETNHLSNLKHDTTLGFMHMKYPDSFGKLVTYIEDFCKSSSLQRNYENPNHAHRPDIPLWKEAYIDNQKVNVMWGARAESGQIATPHDHWPTIWTFCYYIQPPEGCSGLYFRNSDYELPVEHGLLVIFNSNLIHETLSREFKGERFCVSGTVVSNPL